MNMIYERNSLITAMENGGFGAPVIDGNMGVVDPVTIATVALSIANILGLGTDKKKGYREYDAASKQVVAATGPDLIAGSQVLQLDPGMVAQAVSEYLRDDYRVNLSAQQILTNIVPVSGNSAVSGAGNNMLMWYVLGGAALVATIFVLRK